MNLYTTLPKPLFSVLMANYNRGQYIGQAIKSILEQTYSNIELVIVDDGSTDNSIDVIKKNALADTRIRLYEHKLNKGCGFAMSVCASLAKGDFMGYVGSDDVLLPNAVEVLVNAHQEFPECSLIYSTHYVCDEKLDIKRLAYGAGVIPNDESYLSCGKGVTSFASFTKHHYNQTEGVNKNFKRSVDQDLYYKLEEVGRLMFIDKPLYKYRVNDSGISTKKNISGARYWFVKAKENAYYRRLNKQSVKNIDQKELNAWKSVSYITKASDEFCQLHIWKGVQWLSLSLRQSIFDKYAKLKVQSLFLNSWFHGVYPLVKGKWERES